MTDLAHTSTAQPATPSEARADLLSALSGKQASRDRRVGENTRRVVRTSSGVLRDQEAGRKRSRSLALASLVIALFVVGPFVWHLADDLIGGEHISDPAAQISLWACILCPAILAAFLFAGWSGRKN